MPCVPCCTDVDRSVAVWTLSPSGDASRSSDRPTKLDHHQAFVKVEKKVNGQIHFSVSRRPIAVVDLAI
jgi:hypothetical protein